MLNPLNLFSKLFKTHNQKELNRLEKIVSKINQLEPNFTSLQDKDFPNKTNEFNQHIKTSTHLHFIQNYENYYKEVDEALDTIKDLRIEIDKLKKKKTKLKNKNKE